MCSSDLENIAQVSIVGLKGATYLDKVESYAQKTETDHEITISSEVDRTYLDTADVVEIHDRLLRRKIRIDKMIADNPRFPARRSHCAKNRSDERT